MRKDDITPVGYKVKAGSKSKIDSKQLVAGYIGNSFESAEIEIYSTDSEAIKKAMMFGDSIVEPVYAQPFEAVKVKDDSGSIWAVRTQLGKDWYTVCECYKASFADGQTWDADIVANKIAGLLNSQWALKENSSQYAAQPHCFFYKGHVLLCKISRPGVDSIRTQIDRDHEFAGLKIYDGSMGFPETDLTCSAYDVIRWYTEMRGDNG